MFDETFANLTLFPFVSLTAQTTSAATLFIHGAAAVADATYSFQVTGGNVGDTVPLLISTTLETLSTESDSAHSSGFAELNINTSAVGFRTLAVVCTDGSCGTSATSFIGTLSTFARSGAIGDFINLHVQSAASGTNRPFNEFASAFADPFIYIDPAFPNAALYSIVVSPGVGNAVAPVPEPGVLYLIGTALGALVLLRRRRAHMDR